MRILRLTCALIAMTLPVSAFAESQQADAARERDAIAKVRKAVDAAEAGDCATATKIIVPMLDRQDSPLPAELRGAVYPVAISCEVRLGRKADAYRLALAGSALDNSDDDVWRMRVALELDDHRQEAAVASVEAMAQGRGAALNALPIRWFYELDRDLKSAGLAAQRRRLLTILAANAYAPVDEVPGANDAFRHRLAVILLDAGDRAGATALLAEIGDAHELVDIVFDPRLRPLLPASFDLRAAVERELAAMRTFSALHPDLLAPVLQVASDLRLLGRPQESLETLQALHGVEDGTTTFKDADRQRVWWWDGVARSEAQLDHYDAAVAAFRKGSEEREGGNLNVSQVVNLADLQLDFARPAEALATIGVFDAAGRPASPYGMMQVHFARGCAQARSDRPTEVAATLKYMRDHEKDAPDALTDMLLCSGDLDGASASILRRLADPDSRPDMLRRAAMFDAPAVALPPNPVKTNLDKVLARPEVQAALQRAGGAQRIHLQQNEL